MKIKEIKREINTDITLGHTMLDVTCNDNDDFIEINIREDDKVFWINMNGQCIFRACQIPNLVVHRGRKSFIEITIITKN